MSNIHNRTDILYKFVSNLLDTVIDIDVLQMLKEQSSAETTPLIYSIMNIWQQGEQTILSDNIIYEYENKLMKVFKQTYTIETEMLEFFRIVIINELDDLSLYMDLSEKLSFIILFIYACFYNNILIKPFILFINDYLPNQNCLLSIYNDVSNVLGGDF